MTCACGNAARYVSQTGELVCGTCPIKRGEDSIRISDVPRLLDWALPAGCRQGRSWPHDG